MHLNNTQAARNGSGAQGPEAGASAGPQPLVLGGAPQQQPAGLLGSLL